MTPPPEFARDAAGLPDDLFSYKSLTWWGVIGYMVIEATAFALLIGAYFFVMSREQDWAPRPRIPPDLLAGTLFTLIALLSEIPNRMIKTAAIDQDLPAVRRILPWMVAVGALLIVIRGFEFNSLNVLWYENAYGSLIWALLVMHSAHLGTDWGDTVVLWRLMKGPHGKQKRHFVDTDENALYWRFVWGSWIVVYVLIYWVPRLFR